jgi:hypothetical protein
MKNNVSFKLFRVISMSYLEFLLSSELIYLNHTTAIAPEPKRTAQAIKSFVEQNMRYGSHQ